MSEQKLRVWWIPQIPMKSFYWPVGSVEEGVRVMQLLTEYDEFQYENGVKPDYSNVGGLQAVDEDGDWVDWWYDDDTVCFDDPEEYLAWKQAKEKSQ